MDFGIFLPPVATSGQVVKRAEDLGFSRAWFYDTQMLNSELFAIMGATAMVTKKIRLATGVMIPSNRIAPVAACGLATLNALAPGRIDWGIATGSTARSTMGLTRVKQADLEEYIRIVRALLAGETTEWTFEEKHRKIRFMDPDVPAINIRDPIPLHISAGGPKGRALIARLKAGLIDTAGNVERSKQNVEDLKAAWMEAGNKPDELRVTNTISGAILRPGESADSPRVKSVAGPSAMVVLHQHGADAARGTPLRPLPPQFQPLVTRYAEIYRSYQPEDARYLTNHKGHRMYLRPEEQEIVTGDLIKAFTMTGPKQEIREKIREMARNGVTHFAPSITHRHPETLEEWADLFDGV